MKKRFRVFGIIALLAVIGFFMAACDDGGDSISPDAPEITKLVVGIRLIDDEKGTPEKTTFNKGDHFYYGFRASDPQGDWKRMVHTVKGGGGEYDYSWDITGDFIGAKTIGTNGGYPIPISGTFELSWYILDQAGNKSNVIKRTVTVN